MRARCHPPHRGVECDDLGDPDTESDQRSGGHCGNHPGDEHYGGPTRREEENTGEDCRPGKDPGLELTTDAGSRKSR